MCSHPCRNGFWWTSFHNCFWSPPLNILLFITSLPKLPQFSFPGWEKRQQYSGCLLIEAPQNTSFSQSPFLQIFNANHYVNKFWLHSGLMAGLKDLFQPKRFYGYWILLSLGSFGIIVRVKISPQWTIFHAWLRC